MLTERRRRILTLVAESYVDAARPVPSSWIAERLDVSAATVRNEFAALEEAGYLQQPHTSAGRVPTAEGFLAYAGDHIPPRRLPEAQRARLEQRLERAHGDERLRLAAEIAAELSGYAVVLTLPADDGLRALEIHLAPLSSRTLLAVAVLETGLVRQLVVQVDPLPDDDVLDDAESSLRQMALPLGEVATALRSIAQRSEPDLARTLEAVALAWGSLAPPRLFSRGLRNLLAEPESRDPEFLRAAVERVETPDAAPVEGALALALEGALASVRAGIDLGAAGAGRASLALVGPARMRYPEALMIAGGVSEVLAGSGGSGGGDASPVS